MRIDLRMTVHGLGTFPTVLHSALVSDKHQSKSYNGSLLNIYKHIGV